MEICDRYSGPAFNIIDVYDDLDILSSVFHWCISLYLTKKKRVNHKNVIDASLF